jgi:hypothetical protein
MLTLEMLVVKMLMSNDTKFNFVQYINASTINRFEDKKSVIFGQNIVAGSRISGLGAGLDQQKNIITRNSPNVENSLMGFGLGLMLTGTDSALIMKQHDFALLGLDQLTNTVNVAKTYSLSASFIVMMVVVDSGFEGPQASLNNLDEFASLSRSPVHFLNTRENIDRAFKSSKTPGLHMMALSQKSMKLALVSYEDIGENVGIGELIRNSSQSSTLLIYFGLDLNYLNEINSEFNSHKVATDHLIVSGISSNMKIDEPLISHYKSIVVIDTSKSEISYAQMFSHKITSRGRKVTYVGREPSIKWSYVNGDQPEITPKTVYELWKGNSH